MRLITAYLSSIHIPCIQHITILLNISLRVYFDVFFFNSLQYSISFISISHTLIQYALTCIYTSISCLVYFKIRNHKIQISLNHWKRKIVHSFTLSGIMLYCIFINIELNIKTAHSCFIMIQTAFTKVKFGLLIN